jgi:hypothetical protein
MNFAIEGTSLFGWWCAFQLGQKNMPKGPLSTVISGAASGLIVAGITTPMKNVRQFPETIYERKLLPPNQHLWNTFRLASCHAVLFTVYTGLKDSIYKAREIHGRPEERDYLDCINEFFAGGIAGLCYRAASFGYGKGPLKNPFISQPRFLASSFLTTATAIVLFESIDYHVANSSFFK